LAEDNPVNRNIALKFLKTHHHKVDTVENGLEAYEAFLTKKYDVILMGISTPPLLLRELTFGL
jgi:CheY-like chemotaxis protein